VFRARYLVAALIAAGLALPASANPCLETAGPLRPIAPSSTSTADPLYSISPDAPLSVLPAELASWNIREQLAARCLAYGLSEGSGLPGGSTGAPAARDRVIRGLPQDPDSAKLVLTAILTAGACRLARNVRSLSFAGWSDLDQFSYIAHVVGLEQAPEWLPVPAILVQADVGRPLVTRYRPFSAEVRPPARSTIPVRAPRGPPAGNPCG
jgi:hypothetical protein